MKLMDNTIIVFWSDHGYLLGQHGHWMKQTLWDGVARNPLLVAGPGVRANQASPRTVEFVDVYPTLADLCGLTGTPSNLPGQSLRPLLRNARAKWNKPALTQTQRTRNKTQFMGYSIRDERYRYTEWDEGRQGAELYDYQVDPKEDRNFASDPGYAKVVARMKALLQNSKATAK